MRLLSLFSGIGAFEKALTNLGIPVDLVGYCEIDKYASRSYAAVHGVSEDLNLKDVTKVDTNGITDVDLITYGFPCQDISNAGYQRGFVDEDGNRTRSGLFFEALRIIRDVQPKFAIAENVKALTGKKFTNEFATVLKSLEDAGYVNYWKVLNAKDFGIPQNRERVFIISIRKDIDKGFEFPKPIPLTLRLKDVLDDNVDEKFYLSDKQINTLIHHKEEQARLGRGFGASFNDESSEYARTILARYYKDGSECLIVSEATRKGYAEAGLGDSVNLEQPNSKTRRVRVGHGVAQTLTTSCNQAVVVGRINSSQDGVVVDPNGIAPTCTAGHVTMPKIVVNDND